MVETCSKFPSSEVAFSIFFTGRSLSLPNNKSLPDIINNFFEDLEPVKPEVLSTLSHDYCSSRYKRTVAVTDLDLDDP